MIHYGTIPPVNAWDPFWVNFHTWYHMLFVQPQWDGVLAPLRHWTPPGGKCPKLGSRLNPKGKFEAQPTTRLGMGLAAVDCCTVLVCGATLATIPWRARARHFR